MAWLAQLISAGGSIYTSTRPPVKNERVMTDVQRDAQNRMINTASKPYQKSPMMGEAENLLMQILSGKTDPFTSPAYKNTRRQIKDEEGRQATMLQQKLEKGGTRYGTPVDQTWSKFYTGTNRDILDLLGATQEREKSRQFSAIPMAKQLSNAENEYNMAMAQLNSFLMNPAGEYPDYSPNPMSALSPLLMDIAGMFGNMNTNPGGAAKSGSSIKTGVTKKAGGLDPYAFNLNNYQTNNIPGAGTGNQMLQKLVQENPELLMLLMFGGMNNPPSGSSMLGRPTR